MFDKGSITCHDCLNGLISNLVMIAIVCICLLELISIEEVCQQNLGEFGAMRVVIANSGFQCVEEIFVNGMNLLDITEQILVYLCIIQESLTGYHYFFNDKLDILTIGAF